ncbi:hypothetical protein CRUP_009637 [Coryphaenoides rupestris]|nr:hypothetical protein CRUP_009637 [Coryphaenoides rupestris]
MSSSLPLGTTVKTSLSSGSAWAGGAFFSPSLGLLRGILAPGFLPSFLVVELQPHRLRLSTDGLLLGVTHGLFAGARGVLTVGRLLGRERGAPWRGGGRHRGLPSQLWGVGDLTPTGVERIYVLKVIGVPFVRASGEDGCVLCVGRGLERGKGGLFLGGGGGGGVSTRDFLALRRVPPGLGVVEEEASGSSCAWRGLPVRGLSFLFASGVVLEEAGPGLSGLESCLARGFFFREPGRPFLGLRRVPGALSVSTLNDSAHAWKPAAAAAAPPSSGSAPPSRSPPCRLREAGQGAARRPRRRRDLDVVRAAGGNGLVLVEDDGEGAGGRPEGREFSRRVDERELRYRARITACEDRGWAEKGERELNDRCLRSPMVGSELGLGLSPSGDPRRDSQPQRAHCSGDRACHALTTMVDMGDYNTTSTTCSPDLVLNMASWIHISTTTTTSSSLLEAPDSLPPPYHEVWQGLCLIQWKLPAHGVANQRCLWGYVATGRDRTLQEEGEAQQEGRGLLPGERRRGVPVP